MSHLTYLYTKRPSLPSGLQTLSMFVCLFCHSSNRTRRRKLIFTFEFMFPTNCDCYVVIMLTISRLNACVTFIVRHLEFDYRHSQPIGSMTFSLVKNKLRKTVSITTLHCTAFSLSLTAVDNRTLTLTLTPT